MCLHWSWWGRSQNHKHCDKSEITAASCSVTCQDNAFIRVPEREKAERGKAAEQRGENAHTHTHHHQRSINPDTCMGAWEKFICIVCFMGTERQNDGEWRPIKGTSIPRKSAHLFNTLNIHSTTTPFIHPCIRMCACVWAMFSLIVLRLGGFSLNY